MKSYFDQGDQLGYHDMIHHLFKTFGERTVQSKEYKVYYSWAAELFTNEIAKRPSSKEDVKAQWHKYSEIIDEFLLEFFSMQVEQQFA